MSRVLLFNKTHVTVFVLSQVPITGSNMIFHSLTLARSRGNCCKPRVKHKNSTLPDGPSKC